MEPLLVILLYQTHRALSLPTRQSQSQSALVGSDVIIPCTFSNDPVVDSGSLSVSWSFQGKEILPFDSSEKPPDPRFSLHGDTGSGQASLSIRNVSIEDEGIYKCSVMSQDTQEIRLYVRARPYLTVAKKSVIEKEESLLRCTATGFYPKQITFIWTWGGETLQDVVLHHAVQMANGTYSTTSEVLITMTKESGQQDFSCGVNHSSLTEPIHQNFKIIFGDAPSFDIHYQKFSLGEEQTLVCKVWGFYPQSVVVKWFLNGTHETKERVRRLDASDLESSCDFKPTCEHNGIIISCQVEHDTLPAPTQKNLTVHLEGCVGPAPASRQRWVVLAPILLFLLFIFYIYRYILIQDFPSRPNVGAIQVPPVLLINGDVSLKCLISDYFPDDVTVCWYKVRNGIPELLPEDPGGNYRVEHERNEQEDKTFTCRTSITFTPTLAGDRGAEFICKVCHPLLEEPIETSTGKLKVLGRPEVDGITMLDDYKTFSLTMDKFFPRPLGIQWQMVNTSTEESTDLSCSVHTKCNDDGSFRTVSECTPPIDTILPNQQYEMRAGITHESIADEIWLSYSFEQRV